MVCGLAKVSPCNGKVEDMDFDMNYYLATAYFKNGQAQEAIQAYNAILALRPKEMDAYYLRGCVELSQNDYEKAQADFDAAIALDPKNYDQMIRIYIWCWRNTAMKRSESVICKMP